MNELQVSRVCEHVPLPEQSVVSVDLCRWICVYGRATVCALQQLRVVVCMYPTLGLAYLPGLHLICPSPSTLCSEAGQKGHHKGKAERRLLEEALR